MAIRPKVAKTLATVNQRTKIAGKPDPKREVDASYFDVYDLQFLEGETPEEGGQTITISGNKFAIALQASLLDGVREIVRYELAKIGIGGGDDKEIFKRRGHPEVKLIFYQKRAEAEKGYLPLKGEISFDLMDFVDTADKVSATQKLIQQSDITNLSKKIKSIFTPQFNWLRGTKIVVYHDWGRGYNLQIYCEQEEEGLRVAKAVCQIQNHTIKDEFLKLSEPLTTNNKKPIPKEEVILGKKVKQKRYRPIGTVYFSHATLTLPTYGTKIVLA